MAVVVATADARLALAPIKNATNAQCQYGTEYVVQLLAPLVMLLFWLIARYLHRACDIQTAGESLAAISRKSNLAESGMRGIFSAE